MKRRFIFNFVSFEPLAFRPTFLQFFDPFQIVVFVGVLKISFCLSDDSIVGAKSVSTEPFLQVWKQLARLHMYAHLHCFWKRSTFFLVKYDHFFFKSSLRPVLLFKFWSTRQHSCLCKHRESCKSLF